MSTATKPEPKSEPKAEKDSPSNPNYRGPAVEVGMPVLWYPQGDRFLPPCAAMVTAVGMTNVCVSILEPESRGFAVRDGVFHLTDLRCKKAEMIDNGAWDYTPSYQRFLRMEATLKDLTGPVK